MAAGVAPLAYRYPWPWGAPPVLPIGEGGWAGGAEAYVDALCERGGRIVRRLGLLEV